MPHPTSAFKAKVHELEGRLLLASTPSSSPVEFVGFAELGAIIPSPIQIVTQQAGEATVTLSRSDTAGPLQVEVRTGQFPGGVSVGAVDQAVTFAPGQSLATVSVPIIAGAPNPGAVDASLIVSSTDGTVLSSLLDLRIVASDPTLPPRVVSSFATSRGVVLSFNKPMDPVGASNPNNYSMSLAYPTTTGGFLGIDAKTKTVVKPVRFESAQYDPATQTVTLIPKHPLPRFVFSTLTWSEVTRPTRPARSAHSSNVAPGLNDLQGHPINADTTPGKVAYRMIDKPIGGSF